MTATFYACNPTNYTVGREKKIDHIVIHYTAGNGDTAENNGNYYMGANRKASAHYFVDEDSVVLSVRENDTAWHAGNWAMNCRSIGIEMCSRKDENGKYYIPEKTVQKAVELTAHLMKKHNIPISNVIRHYDVTGKVCPAPFVENPTQWQEFLSRASRECVAEKEKIALWACEAWQSAKEKGVLDGTRPQDPVTRQELAVILQRLNLI